MVKIITIAMLSTLSFGDSFDTNCLACHKKSEVPLDMIYKRYLLKYSSPKSIKSAMIAYLKAPSFESSQLPKGLLMNMPIKPKSTLSQAELEKSVDEYLNRYDIKKRLRAER